jgi:Protein of unknown function (DUF3040)
MGAQWERRWEGNVPLSEHEQRVLEQIERALYADDPKFAATVRGIDPRAHHRRRYFRAVVGAVVGVALLPVGIAVNQLEVSVAGFLLTLLALLYGVATWRHTRERADGAAGGRPAGGGTATAPKVTPIGARSRRRRQGNKANKGNTVPTRPTAKRGFMERFEERWNRRRDGLGN